MQLTLALDAAGALGTVAVVRGDALLAEHTTTLRGEAGERLLPAAVDALAAAGARMDDLEAVLCGAGPGGFTGLRIAAGIAKGIATARGIPLRAASSLLLGAAAAGPLDAGRYLVALDAMRGELFTLELQVGPRGWEWGPDRRLPAAEAERVAAVEGLSQIPGARGYVVVPHARGLAQLGHLAPAAIATVPLDSWEPHYGRKAEAQVKWEARHGRELA
jgi:tRNA threonylcarbamoyladenosine biosynthesis protein TsaB